MFDIYVIIREALSVNISIKNVVFVDAVRYLLEIPLIDSAEITCVDKINFVNRVVKKLLCDGIQFFLICFQAQRHICTISSKYASACTVCISCGIDFLNRHFQVLDNRIAVFHLHIAVFCFYSIFLDITQHFHHSGERRAGEVEPAIRIRCIFLIKLVNFVNCRVQFEGADCNDRII